MKLYLCGPITPRGWRKKREFERNIMRFFRKASELRQLGHEIYCPPEKEPPNRTWTFYLAHDIRGLIEFNPDALYIMTGWENSKGANLELEWATQNNIKIIYES